MHVVWTGAGAYRRAVYKNETADFDEAILQVKDDLFGPNRHNLNVKKKIGSKGGLNNIPDGYLIDLNGDKPRLYTVENELAAHDYLRHIAVQILEFSLSFKSKPRRIKGILWDALQTMLEARQACEQYAAANGYRNLDYLLEWLVFETPFTALVIIDEMPEDLENVLLTQFRFGVQVLELARYENEQGHRYYHFEPFLSDVTGVGTTSDGKGGTSKPTAITDLDTLVVPAREDGFQETFLGAQRWYAVRINGTMWPQIKHVAAYRVAPHSAITYVAPVSSIEPWQDTGKVVLNFSESAHEIGPIPKGQKAPPQNVRYTSLARLQAAKTLDDLW